MWIWYIQVQLYLRISSSTTQLEKKNAIVSHTCQKCVIVQGYALPIGQELFVHTTVFNKTLKTNIKPD